MKRVLGLDLGVASIGWAYILEAENENETSEIVRMGVRIVPVSHDEKKRFMDGKTETPTQIRRIKRGMRRNLDRYQLRRDKLIDIFIQEGWITDREDLAPTPDEHPHYIHEVRAKAVDEQVSLRDLARIFLAINKKRGYKSNRKIKGEDEGSAINAVDVVEELNRTGATVGEYIYTKMQADPDFIVPQFYTSNYEDEFHRIWSVQRQFYPDQLTDALKQKLWHQSKKTTAALLKEVFNGMEAVKPKGKKREKRMYEYSLRSKAVRSKVEPDELIYVLMCVNGDISKATSHLGKISDRSFHLQVKGWTVGQYLWNQLRENPHSDIKNRIFFRKDYEQEFERIWETQRRYYPDKLTDALKRKIGKETIFYQRPLKSQKKLLSYCIFESQTKVIEKNGVKKEVRIGYRVAPKSSPLVQEFNLWQVVHNLRIVDLRRRKAYGLAPEVREIVFNELNWREKISQKDMIKLLKQLDLTVETASEERDNGEREIPLAQLDFELNYREIKGNATNALLLSAYQKMMEEVDWPSSNNLEKKTYKQKMRVLEGFFDHIGVDKRILYFDGELEGKDFIQQPAYQLWHLLYSYESDNSQTGQEKLIQHLQDKFGFPRRFAEILADVNINSIGGYSRLSSKAIRKMFPFIKEHSYSEAAHYAGYRHSFHETKEEIQQRELKDRLDIVPKNKLRNPVVEKILNQMVHVVNAILADERMGRPDEIRIELARELKRDLLGRKRMIELIRKNTKNNERIRNILQERFKIPYPTRADITRYKLWEEIETLGFKEIYNVDPNNDKTIPDHELFTNKVNVDHIIPQSVLFDDSFSNKVLTYVVTNEVKGNRTAYDFIRNEYGEEGLKRYEDRVRDLYKKGIISKAKRNKLLMSEEEVEKIDFINRDRALTRYITREAKKMLKQVCRSVVVTSGMITNELREAWGLINVMKEINFPRYQARGLLIRTVDRNGQERWLLKDWTKRDDHRHHAVDALIVAFTTLNHVNFFAHRSARGVENITRHDLRNLLMYKDPEDKQWKFKLPMPHFRAKAKEKIREILVSHKAKNKVVTPRLNRIRTSHGYIVQKTLTPRGQLHKETVYRHIQRYEVKYEEINSSFTIEKILRVAKKPYREALLKRLEEFGGNPKRAFTGKNSLKKNPILLPWGKPMPEKVGVLYLKDVFTKRVPVTPDLKIKDVVDAKIRRILQQRLDAYGGDAKKAFSDLERNPIWLDRAKGMALKHVRVLTGEKPIPLRPMRDHLGHEDPTQPTDYHVLENNHHVAIYRDPHGKYHERVVSFFEAVQRKLLGLPVVDKTYNSEIGWEFVFSLKKNEMFVFPSEEDGFDPREIDLMDPKNKARISPHLFRVQKFSKTGTILFTNHIEAINTKDKEVGNKRLKGMRFYHISTVDKLKYIVKVRLNHLGDIVHVGEY